MNYMKKKTSILNEFILLSHRIYSIPAFIYLKNHELTGFLSSDSDQTNGGSKEVFCK